MSDQPDWVEDEKRIWQAKENLTVSQWAARHRFVVKGPAPGLWQNELTPYLVEPMDTFNDPWVRHIVLNFAPQTGKSSVAINCLLYSIDQDPGSAMYIMPDEKVARRIARRQLIPTIRATPRINRLLSPSGHDTSTLAVQFSNGADLMMAWASSPAVMASESIRYLFRDEPGKYPDFSGKEADPFSLSEVRMNAFPHTSKLMDFSTPNLSDDPFDTIFQNEPDEVRLYHARCPFCETYQLMSDEKIHAKGARDPNTIERRHLARYSCSNCGQDWDDNARNKAVAAGRWEAIEKVDRPRCVAFGPLPSWYSPFVSLSKILAKFFKSKENPDGYMAYCTQHRCQAWKEVIEPKEEKNILDHRSEYPAMVVPPGCIALTCGIDVQKNGCWFVVRAWQKDLTSYGILHGYFSSFADIENLIFSTRFPVHGSNQTMGIWRAAMDTGGGVSSDNEWTRTEEIYQWLRANGRNVVFGVKGASRVQLKRVNISRIDKMSRGNRTIPGGLELRILDTSQFKDLLHWRLTRKDNESQRFYLHSETGMDYARQFLAEEKRRDRRRQVVWTQTRADNHILDAEVYAAACADSEWIPSITMLAKRMEHERQNVASPPNRSPASSHSNSWIQPRRAGDPREGSWFRR